MTLNPSVLLAWLIPVTIVTYCLKIPGITSCICILSCWMATAILHVNFLQDSPQKPSPRFRQA